MLIIQGVWFDVYEKLNPKKSLNNVHEPRNAEFTAFLEQHQMCIRRNERLQILG